MGWTFTHDQGRIALDEHFGDAVETVVAESVAEGADAERVMTQMILGGADMIVATSFGFGPAVNAVAGRFPDVLFRTRHGLHARASERLHLRRALLRGPGRDGPYRGSHDREQHHRLHRILPDPPR